MQINVANVLSSVTKAVEKSAGLADNYKLVYPQDGELKVKLLYNPPTQIVMRLINRHLIDDKKVPCMSQYGKACPICSAVNKIEQMNPNFDNLWKLRNNRRAILFAEYLSSSYAVSSDPRYQPDKGEVILLMIPYIAYTELSQMLAKAGEGMTKYISENKGKVISITRYRKDGRVQYNIEEDSLIKDHATRKSDKEFDELLLSLPSINDKIVPDKCTPEIEESVQRVANILEVEHFGRRVSNYVDNDSTDFDQKYTAPSTSTTPEKTVIEGKTYVKSGDGNWVLDEKSSMNTPVQSSTQDNPECFGNFDENNSKCDLCPQAWDCQEA